MSQFETQAPVRTVPDRSGTSLLRTFERKGPPALVVTGLAATLLWVGFLGWCAFEAVAWAVG